MAHSFDAMIRAAKAGDEAAATLLYQNHVAMVFGYFRACGASEVDDLTSEVFVGMLRNLHRFEGDQPAFRRWLMTIAHRRLVDERRRQVTNKTELAGDDELEGIALDSNIVELRALTVDPQLIVAFNGLTEPQREVLALRFIADVSLVGVADITDRPVGAVKSLQNRGLAGLRRHLDRLDAGQEA